MYDMYPDWGPASHHPENPRSAENTVAALQAAHADGREQLFADEGGERLTTHFFDDETEQSEADVAVLDLAARRHSQSALWIMLELSGRVCTRRQSTQNLWPRVLR